MWWACRDTLVHRESRWQHGFVKGVVTRSCDAAVCPLLMQETSASLPWQHKEQPLPKSFDRVMQDFKVERRTHPLQCAASSSSVTWYQGKFQQSGRLQPGPMNVVRDTDHRTRSYVMCSLFMCSFARIYWRNLWIIISFHYWFLIS